MEILLILDIDHVAFMFLLLAAPHNINFTVVFFAINDSTRMRILSFIWQVLIQC